MYKKIDAQRKRDWERGERKIEREKKIQSERESERDTERKEGDRKLKDWEGLGNSKREREKREWKNVEREREIESKEKTEPDVGKWKTDPNSIFHERLWKRKARWKEKERETQQS